MNNGLKKKYGLVTAIAMVVGIVIGSGVFFKAQTVLQKTEGDMPLGILAWAIGGAIMLSCILAFSGMAQKYEKVNGVVDYAEATVGKKYAYLFGWFSTMIYYPTMTSVLAWLSARYTLTFLRSCWPGFPLLSLGGDLTGAETLMGPDCLALMMLFLVGSYTINALSPKIAGHFQTTTTVIKLIPLVLMSIVGIIVGVFGQNHMLIENFAHDPVATSSTGEALLSAVCATAFAYEGWIIATSINSEIKNSKRNLPIALVSGGIIIMAVYIAYYLGVSGGATVDVLMNEGATSAFTNVFGRVFGNILNLFVAVSCMGTMNGLMLGCTRGLYSVAARGQGPAPKTFSQIDAETNMPNNSAVVGLFLCALWGVYFYCTQLAGTWNTYFAFDSSEIPIITIYPMYIPIFVMWMKKQKDEKFTRRFLFPTLAILGSLFMVYAAIVGHGMHIVYYLILYIIVMAIGVVFMKKKVK